MTGFLHSHRPGRGLLVAIVVGVATAALASRVALDHRQGGEAVAHAAIATPPAAAALGASVTAGDPSLPAAAEALERVEADPGEPAPTF